MNKLISVFLLMMVATGTNAASGEAAVLDHIETDVTNIPGLQRGAKYFINYCYGCHSIKYLRYTRLMKDLELTEEQVTDNMIFSGAKVSTMMTTSMRPADSSRFFGTPPPDLSLVARARGTDWVYTYLRSFYPDKSRPSGWNNTRFKDVSMPNPLWELQGTREPIFETHVDARGDQVEVHTGWTQVSPGLMTEHELDQVVQDLTVFLEYASEPAKIKRKTIGTWVLLYLVFFTFLAYLLKVNYWRDVH
jgi:ubiquinol-cytochrome c reductase cytochrome c1 subunit